MEYIAFHFYFSGTVLRIDEKKKEVGKNGQTISSNSGCPWVDEDTTDPIQHCFLGKRF